MGRISNSIRKNWGFKKHSTNSCAHVGTNGNCHSGDCTGCVTKLIPEGCGSSLPPSWPSITYTLQPLHKRNINTCSHTTTECYYQVTGGIVSTAILEFIYISRCESCHRSTYSPDLRWSMVWQREVLEYIYEDMTINLNVDKAIVWRIVKLLRLVKWRSSLAQPDSQGGESGQLPM